MVGQPKFPNRLGSSPAPVVEELVSLNGLEPPVVEGQVLPNDWLVEQKTQQDNAYCLS